MELVAWRRQLLDPEYCDVVAPWSQILSLAWAPALTFFETRAEFLRELEADGCLSAFRWDNGIIGARLDDTAILELGSTGALLMISDPDGDRSVGECALGKALMSVAPVDIRVRSASFQFVLPLVGDYDEVRRWSLDRLLTDAVPDDSPYDWSILIDGRLDQGVEYQVEYGVINDEEAAPRLMRHISRLASHGPAEALPTLPWDFWRLEALPSVALFMDWRMSPSEELGIVQDIDGVVEVWATLADECERMAGSVYRRVQEQPGSKKGTGS